MWLDEGHRIRALSFCFEKGWHDWILVVICSFPFLPFAGALIEIHVPTRMHGGSWWRVSLWCFRYGNGTIGSCHYFLYDSSCGMASFVSLDVAIFVDGSSSFLCDYGLRRGFYWCFKSGHYCRSTTRFERNEGKFFSPTSKLRRETSSI